MQENDDQVKIGCGYIRVSTGKQEELSPDSQKRLILEYAKAHNIVIPEEYIFMENGISGRKAKKRPKFQQMIALAKAGKFQVILLWKFSRFARNQEESVVYKAMLRRVNVDVISISEPLIEGPFGSLIERIIEWMDEFYSIRLSGDVTRGMTEKAMRGGYQCRPPLGYTVPYHNATPQIVPEEAEIVRKIFSMYVNEHRSKFQIARTLNALGFKTSHNKPFEARSVEYILANPCYAGFVRWNRKENTSNIIKPVEEWIIREGQQEAIITKELFDAAQTRVKAEFSPRGKRPAETYKHWLSGLIKCSACGRTLIMSGSTRSASSTNAKYYVFQCYGYSKGKCNVSHQISVRKLEPIVMEALRSAVNSGTIEYELKQPAQEKTVSELDILKRQLDRIENKERRIKDAYVNEIDTLAEYKENKKKLEEERQTILAEMESVTVTRSAETDKGMLENLKNVYELLQSEAPIDEKSRAISSVVEKIIFYRSDSHIDLYFYYSPYAKPLEI